MPENNEPQYELDHDYAPLGIVDAADGSGTTWPEFVGQVNKMDNQVAALTEYVDSRLRIGTALATKPAGSSDHVTANVVLDPPLPDANYVVMVTPGGSGNYSKMEYSTDNYTPSGFTINGYETVAGSIANLAPSITVRWLLVRRQI